MDLATLQIWRDKLFEARLKGIRSFRDQNGEEISYSSDREMAAAIQAADREIAALSGGRTPSTIYFKRNC
jgi:hypothetical protein